MTSGALDITVALQFYIQQWRYDELAFLRTILVCLPVLTVSNSLAAADDQTAFGEYLSGECVTCHQLSGVDNGIPSIIGWDAESFVAVMNAYKAKELENKVMITIAGALSDEEIAALAAYFGTIQRAN